MAQTRLEILGVRFARGERTLADIERLTLLEGERVGLIGENGAGKSTLLALIAGELAPDVGVIRRFGDTAWIRQEGVGAAWEDARAAALFRAGEAREGLSGGEQTRGRIADALSRHSAILLADEPTTDLDGEGVRLLKKALEDYRGALVLVSHDRDLLDSVCSRIWHLEDGRVIDFPGGYSAYREERERRRARARFEYDQYRCEQARLRASMQDARERASQMRRAPARMGNSEARLHKMDSRQISSQLHKARRQLESRLEHMEVKERPREDVSIHMALGARSPVRAKISMEIRGLRLCAGDKVLLANASLRLPTGSRTALTGPNGCGKTTLLRAIAACAGLRGEEDVGARRAIRLNPQVKVGWFDQSHADTLEMSLSAVENTRRDSGASESDARTTLARLALRGETALRPVSTLSGGERARVAIAKLLLSDSNLLMLDEPTNHLDVFTREALEELLARWEGTLLVVSHDEAFLRAVASRRIRFEGGCLTEEDMTVTPPVGVAGARERVEVSILEMRMAALAGRMSAPCKGDDSEALKAEYMELARQIREMKMGH